jgi:penicillin-binding protein 1A
MSREGAAVITDMLEAVVLEGTGRRARTLQTPVGGKTGTSNNYKDALFIGFSPSIATGVWVGQDSGRTLGDGETGARAALPIWTQFMKTALTDESRQFFDIPDNLIRVPIDPQSGQLQVDQSKESVYALFKVGTEPK